MCYMNRIVDILIRRDGLTFKEATLELKRARELVKEGDKPADVVSSMFSLHGEDFVEELV